jgi:hypothetical protein
MKKPLAQFACALLLAGGLAVLTAAPASAGNKPNPGCISDEGISYTYDPHTNSGVITVEAPKRGEINRTTTARPQPDTLCEPLYVTATSWTYTGPTKWPQARDVVNELPVITTIGEYEFGAPVSCGQGDIYASREPVPYPSEVLNGRNDPFDEQFLSDLFDGPRTFVSQKTDCFVVTPTDPPVDTPPTDEPPVDTPPTDEPPTDTPPTTEPPVVTDPPITDPPATDPPTTTPPTTDEAAPPALIVPPNTTPTPSATATPVSNALASTGVSVAGPGILAAGLLVLGATVLLTRRRLARALGRK